MIRYQKMAIFTYKYTTAHASYNKYIRKQITLLDHRFREFPLWSAVSVENNIGATLPFYFLLYHLLYVDCNSSDWYPACNSTQENSFRQSLIWCVNMHNYIRNVEDNNWMQKQHLQTAANKSVPTKPCTLKQVQPPQSCKKVNPVVILA